MILTLIGGGIFFAFFGIICFPIIKKFYENISIISSLIGIAISVALYIIPSKLLEMLTIIIGLGQIPLNDAIQNWMQMMRSVSITICKTVSSVMFIFFIMIFILKVPSAISLIVKQIKQSKIERKGELNDK